MTLWIAALVFAAAGLALILARNAAAHGQGLVLGGRVTPGCAVVEGALLLLLAVLVLVFGSRLL